MELTLENLIAYLPYNLSVFDFYDNYEADLIGINYTELDPIRISRLKRSGTNRKLDEIKPILRDPSAIKAMISNNGECFMPLNRLNDIITLGDTDLYKIESFIDSPWTYYFLPSWILEKLLEWKFDIFSLIENDLAIDVNTLKENPYK